MPRFRWQGGLLGVWTALCVAACEAENAPGDTDLDSDSDPGPSLAVPDHPAPDCPDPMPTAQTEVTVSDPAIAEASGLGWDGRWLWTHNDSGGGAQVFAVDPTTGSTAAAVSMPGVVAGDFEDLAAWRRPDGTTEVWVGDVGDNAQVRVFVMLHRLRITEEGTLAERASWKLVYDDEAGHDVEGVMLDPRSDGSVDVVVVSKREDPVVVWRAALEGDGLGEGGVGTFERVRELPAAVLGGETVTGADASSHWVVVRREPAAYAWPRAGGQSIEDAMGGAPCVLPLASEPQGEAITLGDGVLWTLSEGRAQPLYRYEWPDAGGAPSR